MWLDVSRLDYAVWLDVSRTTGMVREKNLVFIIGTTKVIDSLNSDVV